MNDFHTKQLIQENLKMRHFSIFYRIPLQLLQLLGMYMYQKIGLFLFRMDDLFRKFFLQINQFLLLQVLMEH